MAQAHLALWVLIVGCAGALALAGAGGLVAALAAARLQRHVAQTRDAALAIVDPEKLSRDLARLNRAAEGCTAQLTQLSAVSAHLWEVVGRMVRLLLIVRALLGSAG